MPRCLQRDFLSLEPITVDGSKMQDCIRAILEESGRADCVLLVHLDPNVLQLAARQLAEVTHWATLPVGTLLAADLVDRPPSQWPRAAQHWFSDRVSPLAPGPVILTANDLLFHPSLQLDPLVMFRIAARVTRLVVTWPGSFADDHLAYAVPEHTHYRLYHHPQVLVHTLT